VAVERTEAGAPAGRAAIGCAHPRAVLQPLDLAAGLSLAAVAEAAARAVPEPFSDSVASGGYRRRMIAVLIRRLLERLAPAR
jgi:CO/xanthine dehydrogenase FAD-binding subunit